MNLRILWPNMSLLEVLRGPQTRKAEEMAVPPNSPFYTTLLGRARRPKGELGGTAISSAFRVCGPRRTSSSDMLGQSIRRFTTSVVRRSHYEEGPGKNLPFSVENKWRLLAMMTVYFGSGFAAPFFIVRHQLLKK